MRTSVICILAVSALAAPLASAAQKSIEDKAVDLCRQAKAKASSQDWERGPCVHNGGKDLPGWAVDVAHSPRQRSTISRRTSAPRSSSETREGRLR